MSQHQLPGIEVIPQKPPFRFIEQLIDGEPGRFAETALQLRAEDSVFLGHFPDRPVFPGVLMIEQMAQTACWVMAASNPDADRYALVRVEHCEFRQQATPGERLVARAELSRRAGNFAFFDCSVHSNSKRIARAQLLVAQIQSNDAGETHS